MIYGEKTILGPINEQHLPIMIEFRNKPELRQNFREYRLINWEHQYKWWQDKVCNDDSWEYFVIHPIGELKVIGMAGLTYIHRVNRSAEFAIAIGADEYRGKGYGGDALKALIRYGFNELNLHRIYCEVFSNNQAISLYQKLGFIEEGVLRDTYFFDGKYWNSHFLAMLEDRFREQDWAKWQR